MTDMKTRAILFAALAAMLSVSCGQVSDVTEITGKVLTIEQWFESFLPGKCDTGERQKNCRY